MISSLEEKLKDPDKLKEAEEKYEVLNRKIQETDKLADLKETGNQQLKSTEDFGPISDSRIASVRTGLESNTLAEVEEPIPKPEQSETPQNRSFP